MTEPPCPLCHGAGGQVVWQGPELRIVRVVGAEAEAFPAFYRVIWRDHVAEWTDLRDAEQALCLRALNGTERAVRRVLQPTKVNLASLGNVVPHLHWHVIARFAWDTHFPAPVWASATRPSDRVALQSVRDRLSACDDAIASGVF